MCAARSPPFTQELEGDEEGEDEDDADINPKVSWGAAPPVTGVLLRRRVASPCSSQNTNNRPGTGLSDPFCRI